MDELHDIRAEILAKHTADLGDYMRAEFERLRTIGHPIAQVEQRRIRYARVNKVNDSQTEYPSPSSRKE